MAPDAAALFYLCLRMLGKKKKQHAKSPNHKLAHQTDIFVSMVSVVSMVMKALMDMWKVIACAANSSRGLDVGKHLWKCNLFLSFTGFFR